MFSEYFVIFTKYLVNDVIYVGKIKGNPDLSRKCEVSEKGRVMG
ncbi:hypothetical protein B4143_3104 [Bacillus subtilis]|nr:hypothetical protein B4143_3104 [Bacillus subtilis]